ncbi:hypothetical protein BDW67DRAFT_168095 [Aspergillus spinulosporus]
MSPATPLSTKLSHCHASDNEYICISILKVVEARKIEVRLPTSASPSSSPTPDTATETTGPDVNGTSPSSDGLSGGTIAGIVVGLIAGMLMPLGLAVLLWRRRKGKVLRNAHQSNLQGGVLPEAFGVKAVGSMPEIGPGQTRSELNAGAGQSQVRAAELE